MTKAEELTPIEIEILDYLNEKKGRAIDIAKNLDLNQKSAWQALQRVTERGLVSRDEFGIYSITEEGKKLIHDSRKKPILRRALLAARLAHNDKVPDEDLEKLEATYEEILKKIKEAEDRAQKE